MQRSCYASLERWSVPALSGRKNEIYGPGSPAGIAAPSKQHLLLCGSVWPSGEMHSLTVLSGRILALLLALAVSSAAECHQISI